MSDPTPESAYEAAARAYLVAMNRAPTEQQVYVTLPWLRATVDAVWTLGVAEGRRQALAEIEVGVDQLDRGLSLWSNIDGDAIDRIIDLVREGGRHAQG